MLTALTAAMLVVPLLSSCGGISEDCRNDAERLANDYLTILEQGSVYAQTLSGALGDGDGLSDLENRRLDNLTAETDRLREKYDTGKTELLARCGPEIEQQYILP